MNILRTSKHKFIGAAAVCFAGLLTGSLASAHHGHGGQGKGKWSDIQIKDRDFYDRGESLKLEATLTGLDRRSGSSCSGQTACGGHGKGKGKGSQGHRNDDVRVWLSAKAEVRVRCVGKGHGKGHGKGKGKGHGSSSRTERFDVWVEGYERFDARDVDRWGRLDISVETDRYRQKDAERDASCGWNQTVRLEEVRFLEAEIEVKQDRESAEATCDFHPPTRTGRVSRHHVKCYGDC
jgi:hypothetical protein